MKAGWHFFRRLVAVVFMAVWYQTSAHTVVCHGENALSGHGDEGCAATECACVCACHAALVPPVLADVCVSEGAVFVPSDYVLLQGTAVPSDIFRPPLGRA